MRLSVALFLLSLSAAPRPGAASPSLEDAAMPVARELASALVRNGLRKVAIAEFVDEKPGPDLGALGQYAAGGIENRLKSLARPHTFRVVEFGDLPKELAYARLDGDGLAGSPKSDTVDALVAGTLALEGNDVCATVKLISLRDGKAASLSEGETSATMQFTRDDAVRRVAGDGDFAKGVRVYAGAGPDLAPTKLSKCVEMTILDAKGEPLPQFEGPGGGGGTAAFVPARLDQAYQVRLRNGYAEEVGVTLLVDGLNTIDCLRGYGPRDGPMWIIPPGKEIVVKGWLRGTRFYELQFATVANSLAGPARSRLGTISATFFPGRRAPKGLGTTLGARIPNAERPEEFDFRPARGGVTLSVRYDNEDVVRKYTPLAIPANSR